MNRRSRLLLCVGLCVGAVAVLLLPEAANPAREPLAGRANCAAPSALTAIDGRLDRTAARIAEGKRLTILAMGSSSTLGVGATDTAMSYPSRLAHALHAAYPNLAITVLNHGRGGQDVGEELARLIRDLLAEQPDLVIWQVGTNAVLRHDDLVADGRLIRQGVGLIKDRGIDIVLMDLQYAPRVLARRSWGEMEALIADVAERAGVGRFRRFDLMREWSRTRQLAPASLIGPDGLHMTNASYGCLADRLAQSLVAQWRGAGKIAAAIDRSPDALAGAGRRVAGVSAGAQARSGGWTGAATDGVANSMAPSPIAPSSVAR